MQLEWRYLEKKYSVLRLHCWSLKSHWKCYRFYRQIYEEEEQEEQEEEKEEEEQEEEEQEEEEEEE